MNDTPVDLPPASDEWVAPPPGSEPEAPAPTAPRSRWRRYLVPAAVVVAGIAIGAGGALALTGHGGQGSRNTAEVGSIESDQRGGNGDGNGAGPVAGERHVQGTISAVGASSVTVRTTSGTTTYTVGSSTQIMRNGAPATLTELKVGDPVEVHVLPASSGGTPQLERILAGALPQGGPGGFGHRDDGDGTGDGP